MSKIVVVGANHAGTCAINTITGFNEGDEVVVFDQNSNISFLGCGMALWIGGQISKPDGLFYSNKQKLESQGAKVNMNSKVDKIYFDKKVVSATLENGQRIEESYDKLILATGSLPIVPPIPGRDLENVQMVKLFQNAQEVIDKLKNPDIKTIAVVGAGYYFKVVKKKEDKELEALEEEDDFFSEAESEEEIGEAEETEAYDEE